MGQAAQCALHWTLQIGGSKQPLDWTNDQAVKRERWEKTIPADGDSDAASQCTAAQVVDAAVMDTVMNRRR